MGSMLARVARGRAFENLDKQRNTAKGREMWRDILRSESDILECHKQAVASARKLGMVPHTDDAGLAHLEEHWFAPSRQGYFPTISQQARKAALHKAAMRAIDVADRLGEQTGKFVEIRTYWLCPRAPNFEVLVLGNEAQVTVLIVTPHNTRFHGDEWSHDEMWVIGNGDDVYAAKQRVDDLKHGRRGASMPQEHVSPEHHDEGVPLDPGPDTIEVPLPQLSPESSSAERTTYSSERK